MSKKNKGLKIAAAVIGFGIIGGAATFTGLHWDGVKKVAQGPVYSQEELKKENEQKYYDGYNAGLQVNVGYTEEEMENAKNESYEQGFYDGKNFVPEIETIDVINYSQIESCPEELAATSLCEKKLENKRLVSASTTGSTFIFDEINQSFEKIVDQEYNSKVIFNKDNKVIFQTNSATYLLNLENLKVVKVDNTSASIQLWTSSNGSILATYSGLYEIDFNDFTFNKLESESGVRNYKCETNNTIYFSQGVATLKKIDLNTKQITNVSSDFGASSKILLQNENFAVFENMKILNFADDSIQEGISTGHKFSLVYDIENYAFFSTHNTTGNEGLVVLNKTTKEIQKFGTGRYLNKVFEDDASLIFSSTEENGSMFLFDKKTFTTSIITTTTTFDLVKSLNDEFFQLTKSSNPNIVGLLSKSTKIVTCYEIN